MTAQLFGKYELLKKLATGGMAEVFLARQHGIEGFSKMCVVKRILPHLAEDPEFVQMFLNEAKIAARFNHPNIAQIYELGEINGSYFIAMEFIHGEDLGRVMRKAWSSGQWIARQLAMRIIVAACEGLHYAHTKTDEQSRPLKVVHRDISPQNLLISFDGSVKVVDFGIAKAADSASMTKSGAIKGKFAYMAPEQAAGKALDHRSDIFAIGLVLYELITGVRPLKRDSELGTLQAALECDIAPPSQVADVPADLDEMVMRALTKSVEDRYENARHFGQALEEYLVGQRLVATPVQISELMHTLFADRLTEEAKLGHPDPQIANDPMFSQSLSAPAPERSNGGKSVKTTAQEMSWEAPAAEEKSASGRERSNSGEKSVNRSGPRSMAKASYRTPSSDQEKTALPPPDVAAWEAPSAVMPAPRRNTGETRAAPLEEEPRKPAGRTTSGANLPRSRTGEQPALGRNSKLADDGEGTLLEGAEAPAQQRRARSGEASLKRRPPDTVQQDLEDIEPLRTPTGRRKVGSPPRRSSKPEAPRPVEEDEEIRTSDDLASGPIEAAPPVSKKVRARRASSAKVVPQVFKVVAGLALAVIVAILVKQNWSTLIATPTELVPVEITSNLPVNFSVIHGEVPDAPEEPLSQLMPVFKDGNQIHRGDKIILRNAQGAYREFLVEPKKGQKAFKEKAEFKIGSFIPQIVSASKVEGLELWLNNQKLAIYVQGSSVQLVEGTHMLEIRGPRLKQNLQYPVTVRAGGSPTRAEKKDITPWVD